MDYSAYSMLVHMFPGGLSNRNSTNEGNKMDHLKLLLLSHCSAFHKKVMPG